MKHSVCTSHTLLPNKFWFKREEVYDSWIIRERFRLIKRRPSSLNRGKDTCTFPMNLHGVGRSTRPTSNCAPKAHYSIERDLYSIKRALYSIKRALYSIKRALYSIKRALSSRWAPKAHHMMGKTQKGHCEQSFGTHVLVLAINTTTFSRRPNLLKRKSTKMYRTSSEVPSQKTSF